METDNKLQVYNNAVSDIKLAILHSQSKAIVSVNAEQLALYMSIGRYISQNTRTGVWGTGALKYISERLKGEMPGLRGFSERNLKYMRTFYEEWHSRVPNFLIDHNASQFVEAKCVDNSALAIAEFDDSDFKEYFLNIPFTHHRIILTGCKDFEERRFYIMLAARDRLSVDALKKAIAKDEYNHRGAMPNNFIQRLSPEIVATRAVMAFKDEYLLDFINVEELGARDIEEVDERIIEQQIVQNIKNFILTFGRDFAFMGNQYRIDAFGKAHFIDLLFFNRELSCMVAIELKTGPFKQTYLGQLNGYLALLDDFVKKPHESPSIGIVLCKDMDSSYVEYMVRQYDKPMGVATFKTTSDMPENLRKSLPDIEDLKKLL